MRLEVIAAIHCITFTGAVLHTGEVSGSEYSLRYNQDQAPEMKIKKACKSDSYVDMVIDSLR
jgi:hypothetical protein